jgi:hypothetical protein
VKNIQVIDGGLNCAYDIFAATEKEFALIFPLGTDIAFIDEVIARHPNSVLEPVFTRLWKRRLLKPKALGIHGLLFYELEYKKRFYPTRRGEEAVADIAPHPPVQRQRISKTAAKRLVHTSGRRAKRRAGA